MKKGLEFFKEYQSVIVLIPTLLGGFWQLMALSHISISYIRFFSISQLIADGILILFILTLVYLSYKLLKFLSWVINSGLNDKSISKRQIFFKFSVVILIGVAPIIWYIIDIIKTGSISSLFIFESIFFGIFIILLCFHLLVKFEIIDRILEKKLLMVIIISIVGIFSLAYFIPATFSTFNTSFSIPNNLKNIELVNKHLKTKYPNSGTVSIKYFNDKYIFVEINQNNKSEIEIVSFDKLFE